MSRIVGRRQIREGRGLGERLAEILVYIIILAAVIWGGRWYFVVFRNSPKVALGRYLGLLKSGDSKAQYEILSASSKQFFPTRAAYEDKWRSAQNLAGRVAGWEFETIRESGDKAEITAVVNVRRAGQELYQAASDPYKDEYVLLKEGGGWKIALDQSRIKSAEAATDARP
jgi:hypothetical protein